MRKFVVLAVLCLLLIAAPVAYAAEFWDPAPNDAGKFMNSKGSWKYIGPPKNKAWHCRLAELYRHPAASAC